MKIGRFKAEDYKKKMTTTNKTSNSFKAFSKEYEDFDKTIELNQKQVASITDYFETRIKGKYISQEQAQSALKEILEKTAHSLELLCLFRFDTSCSVETYVDRTEQIERDIKSAFKKIGVEVE